MKPKFFLCSFCAVLFFSMLSSAQQEQDARLWLTTPDRTALVALQPGALHFSSEAGASPILTVDDAQHFQPIDGFGFALTGGSAQLLMRMARRATDCPAEGIFTTGRRRDRSQLYAREHRLLRHE